MNIADIIVEPVEPDSPTEFVPPPVNAVRQLAHGIGKMLAERSDQSFADVDAVEGFADFLSLVGTIYAKWLNRTHANADQTVSAGQTDPA